MSGDIILVIIDGVLFCGISNIVLGVWYIFIGIDGIINLSICN